MPFQNVSLTPEKIIRRDKIMQELNQNNLDIKSPTEHYWSVVRDLLKQFRPDVFGYNQEWQRIISENTDYLLVEDLEYIQEPVNLWAKPGSMPQDIHQLLSNYDTNGHFSASLEYFCCMKTEIAEKLELLTERNTEILTELCSMDLESRITTNFKGIYAYAGIDVDLPYLLGGEWLIIEPVLNYEYLIEDASTETRFGKIGISEGRIKLTNSPILVGNKGHKRKPINRDKLDSLIRGYSPDVALIKVPTPGAEYEELLSFFAELLQKETLIISDGEINHPRLLPLSNLVGKEGLKELNTEMVDHGNGGASVPFVRFRLYCIIPDNHHCNRLNISSIYSLS